MASERRFRDSAPVYFSLAGALLLAAMLATFVEIRIGGRPRGSANDLAELRARGGVNLLFILVDTLRADRLGSYGYRRDTSPNLDILARDGVRFARALSQSSWTKCSMASLWTGLHPVRTGVLRHRHALPPEALLPAELLQEAGFRTAGIWRNGWVSPSFGFGQGFDLYQRPRPGLRVEPAEIPNPSAHRLAGSDADLTRSAIEFLQASGHERWFLYLHYMDVHQYAYDEESAKFGTSYSDLYDNAIHWVDRNVGILLAELEARDLLDETLIAVAADHGEAFREHGHEGHARNVYREVTETPLILSFPFRLEPGLVIPTPAENVDLWPTLLDLLGLPPLPGADGRSQVPAIEAVARGRSAPDPDLPAFAHLDRTWGRAQAEPDPLVAVTSGDYRLIHRSRVPDSPELFDHASDPREQVNVADRYPERVDALRSHAEGYLLRPAAAWEAPEVELDPLELDQLRALGYALPGGTAHGGTPEANSAATPSPAEPRGPLVRD